MRPSRSIHLLSELCSATGCPACRLVNFLGMSRSRRSLSIPLLLVCVSTAGDLCGQSPDRFAAIAPRMQEFVDKGEIAGAVTLIANRDTILHLAATGRTDLAKNRKCEPMTSSGSLP